MNSQTSVRKDREAAEQEESDSNILETELSRLQKLSRIGFQVKVEWQPGKMKRHGEKLLAEEVIGDTIFIYSQDRREALQLVAHGFSEWLLNIHSQPYRDMINKLIELFELQQYQNKEKLVESLM